jgi:hypothetical protein
VLIFSECLIRELYSARASDTKFEAMKVFSENVLETMKEQGFGAQLPGWGKDGYYRDMDEPIYSGNQRAAVRRARERDITHALFIGI